MNHALANDHLLSAKRMFNPKNAKVSGYADAGKLEAGSFWGSLTPQESNVSSDLLGGAVSSAEVAPTQQPHRPARRQQLAVDPESPALLIDLMDFGAETTFQLPTTPRRQSGNVGSAFDTAANAQPALHAAASPAANAQLATHAAANRSKGSIAGANQGNSQAAAAPAVAAKQQQSSFPILPPPPQVESCSGCSTVLPDKAVLMHSRAISAYDACTGAECAHHMVVCLSRAFPLGLHCVQQQPDAACLL